MTPIPPSPPDTLRRSSGRAAPPDVAAVEAPSRWERTPIAALGLTLLLAAFVFFPPVRDNPRLVASFCGAAAVLAAWALILWAGARRSGRRFVIEPFPPLRAHYIQSTMQFCIYVYWGWYWRKVYAEAPLFLGQLVFLYGLEALLSWSRGRSWRLGFGPLPIILSTNIFIWFVDDVYYLQFLLVATGALGKEFVKWTREGRRTHIFNPSAFTLALFSIVLIVTDTTHYTWARQIAVTVSNPPHIFPVVFGLGLVVQYFFAVTPMTLAAMATIAAFNLTFLWITGSYYFVDSNIPLPVFIGLTFLMTDPSTSPRSTAGRILFGILYGVLSVGLFGILLHFGKPTLYDKLLPIPLLNLSVKWVDRLMATGAASGISGWLARFNPRRLNLAQMACWILLFGTMLGTGYVGAMHEGSTVAFWEKAHEEGRPNAQRGLLTALRAQADSGSPDAWNHLGLLYLEGRVVDRNPVEAAYSFAKAYELGSPTGARNLVAQFVQVEGAVPGRTVAAAIDQLEQDCGQGVDGRSCFLIGFAYELGRGRPQDKARAADLYDRGCARGDQSACTSAARLRPQLTGLTPASQ